MKIWFAALLGALQGVTEFLPVSSSGHLAVFQRFFGLGEVDMFFDVLLHFATLIAIIVFYRYEILDMLREIGGFFHDLKHPNPDAGEPKPARRLVLMLKYEVTTDPIKGEVALKDDGSFVYTPAEGKRGHDYFGYKAVDSKGNKSSEATVVIKIEKQKSKIAYSDMETGVLWPSASVPVPLRRTRTVTAPPSASAATVETAR